MATPVRFYGSAGAPPKSPVRVKQLTLTPQKLKQLYPLSLTTIVCYDTLLSKTTLGLHDSSLEDSGRQTRKKQSSLLFAPIAQLVEQRPLKPLVVGSSPTGGTIVLNIIGGVLNKIKGVLTPPFLNRQRKGRD